MKTNKKFVDLYAVLRVWPTASEDAIKKAYFAMAKLYHPDVAGKGPEEEGDSDVDFKLINEAYAILIDEGKRREYDERLKDQGGGPTGTAPREADQRSARLAYEQARAAMRSNRYDKAAVLLKSAIKYDDSNPAFYSWYGFALAALKTQLHQARDACKKALEMEFYNSDFHANLGFVYHQAGLTSTANESFNEALKWDPDHPVARKYLHVADGSTGLNIMDKVKSFFGLGSKPEPKQPTRRQRKK